MKKPDHVKIVQDYILSGELRKESLDVARHHIFRMALAVKENIAFNPQST